MATVGGLGLGSVAAAADSFLSLVSQQLTVQYFFAPTLFAGITEATLDLQLPRNALVDRLDVLVQAQRVDLTLLQSVAQVRSYSGNSGHELVIDFGTPRTVSALHLPGGVVVNQVQSWLGNQFSPVPTYSVANSAAAVAAGNGSHAVFSEVRSERLRVLMSRAVSDDELALVTLRLPEPPSGLAIDIDGAPPVWQHAEPVQPRAAVTTPDDDGWDKESRRIVPLAAAFQALTGDPLADEALVSFRLTLRTAVPCRLALSAATAAGSMAWRRIRRLRFGNDTRTTLVFDNEGRAELPLALPPVPAGTARRIDELRWVATADLPPERVLPPLGPDVASTADAPLLADLVVDAQRAACARLPAGSGLALLSAVRLPLAAGPDGAEARVVLWAVDPANPGAVPTAASPQGSSAPVTLAAAAPSGAAGQTPGNLPGTEQWLRFDFAQPQPLNDAAMPWLALVVARGSVSWALGRANGDPADPLNAQLLRRGPPNGPWKALPGPLQGAAGVLDARARLRLVGTAPKAAPLAPLLLQLGSAPAVPVTPGAKGVAGVLAPAGGVAGTPPLVLISRMAGSVQLGEIDVISNV